MIPVIDIAPLISGQDDHAVAAAIDAACRDTGFFYVAGHGVDLGLQTRLDTLARDFFALPEDEKGRIAMRYGGRAWRGWFPVGGELTSGRPDMKEGIYFGRELAANDARVLAGTPLHGPNLFPERPADLGPTVLAYMDAVVAVGHAVLRGMAVGLGLEPDWFARNLTADPLVLFRIFHYPPLRFDGDDAWSVGEHTDYGLVTILRQDATGGLEVHGRDGWIEATPVPDAFVVNLGDMLERMTGGRYKSTPHRVRNATDRDRISFPLFLDPGWDVEVRPLPHVGAGTPGDGNERWDGASVHDWSGTYGDYVVTKVGRVFPELRDNLT